MAKKMTAKQKKYFGKGHAAVKSGGKKATKKGASKMPMKNGKPAFLSKGKKKTKKM